MNARHNYVEDDDRSTRATRHNQKKSFGFDSDDGNIFFFLNLTIIN